MKLPTHIIPILREDVEPTQLYARPVEWGSVQEATSSKTLPTCTAYWGPGYFERKVTLVGMRILFDDGSLEHRQTSAACVFKSDSLRMSYVLSLDPETA